MISQKATRGFGLLEVLLAKKRTKIARRLIEKLDIKKVLDVGCGEFPNFLLSSKFNERFGVDKFINTDFFQNKEVILKQVDIEKEKMPFKDNFFDAVVMLAVFEHVAPKNISFTLREVFRVLKKNGNLILTTPAPWSVPILWTLSRIKLLSKIEIDDHKNLYSRKEIFKLLKEAGFDKKKIKGGFFEFYLNTWFKAEK